MNYNNPTYIEQGAPSPLESSGQAGTSKTAGGHSVLERDPGECNYYAQMILEINASLIAVCIELQQMQDGNGDPELARYQQRLQSNLNYLATTADRINHPENTATRPVALPDFSPFPNPRSRSAFALEDLLAKAARAFSHVQQVGPPRLASFSIEGSKSNHASMTGFELSRPAPPYVSQNRNPTESMPGFRVHGAYAPNAGRH